ncbi:MAG: nucleotidyltransferase domain-containing protein [Acetatifactor sp.]|nr:nucleotidyltransferase domain-containing protein [Acetatifactor sp.]
MFRIEEYIEGLTARLKSFFGDRLLYLGLQGSYLRGEATESSDIDIMVILENMTVTDLDNYREILIEVGDYDRSCGFICGREEMRHWNPLEVCQLLHTTKDYLGRLKDYVPSYTADDERNYVKLSLGNLFHELCHRYIHADRERNISAFPYTCKSAFFILQNMHYLSSGDFLLTKQELLGALQDEEDRQVLALSMALKDGGDYGFDQTFSTLFEWCQHALQRLATAE